MKEQLIKHLKEQGFDIEIEKDGQDTLVGLCDAEYGEATVTFVFDNQGNLKDLWNDWRSHFDELKDEVSKQQKDAELGKSVRTIAKLFNPNLGGKE